MKSCCSSVFRASIRSSKVVRLVCERWFSGSSIITIFAFEE
uniref:Uncharacterized protein n=1 Tax=Pseudomonas aeruginosa TaxID=287 RepID=Q9APU1_PSEAI|nr:hypothetical protein [Pseudomonas aeruginosa]